jgi:hypothetical protein
MRGRTRLMAALSVAIGIAGACGGAGSEPAPAPAPAEPQASPVAAPAALEPAPAPAAPAVIEAPPAAEAPAAAAPEPGQSPKIEKQEGAMERMTAAAKKPVAAPSTAPIAPAVSAPAEPAAATKPATATPCGDEDQPPCPLQGWMEKHMQQPFEADQFAPLAPAFERLAKLGPPDPSWNGGEAGWVTLTQAGAAAARSADRDAVQRACKGCHKAWRSKYKASFRMRAIE